jgi:hypothetical protein
LILPKRNLRGISSALSEKIELLGVEVIDEAISLAL